MNRPLRPFERGEASIGPIRLPPQWDHADKVQIETTPLVPEARHAFTPAELDARIEAMADYTYYEQQSVRKNPDTPDRVVQVQCGHNVATFGQP